MGGKSEEREEPQERDAVLIYGDILELEMDLHELSRKQMLVDRGRRDVSSFPFYFSYCTPSTRLQSPGDALHIVEHSI